jgi:DNA-binding transcriptional LysR family regulator
MLRNGSLSAGRGKRRAMWFVDMRVTPGERGYADWAWTKIDDEVRICSVMETDRLKQFCVIVDTGSLTRAAKLLGISHGGLSKSMATLERYLKTALFKPEGRGIAVTERGLEIYRASQEVLSRVDGLVRGEKSAAVGGTLRLGVPEILTAHFIGKLGERYFPGRPLQCMELDPGQMESAILERRLDYGLTCVPVPIQGVEHVEIRSIGLGAYARKGRFANTPFAEIPIVVPAVPAPSNPLGIKERDGWPDALLPRKKAYSCNLLSAALDLTRSGLCAIFIPHYLAAEHNRSVRAELALESLPWTKETPPIRRTLFLCARSAAVEDADMRKLARAVRETCRD